jgi:hypothetical protein
MTLQNCKVLEPAIKWLREELANFERQASSTRVLIEALTARAGATDSAPTKIAPAKAPPREQHRSPRATPDAQKGAPAQRPVLTGTAPIKAKPPAHRSVSARPPAKRKGVTAPPPLRVNKVSDWHEEDGALTRTLTTVAASAAWPHRSECPLCAKLGNTQVTAAALKTS